MKQVTYYCCLFCVATILVVLTITRPEILSDENKFLLGFVNHEFLAISGVILTITLASAAQVHLKLNEIEEKYQDIFLTKTRSHVRRGAYWLISLFLVSILLVVAKPILADEVWSQSLFNSAAIFILFFMTLVLGAITQLIFAIKPNIND